VTQDAVQGVRSANDALPAHRADRGHCDPHGLSCLDSPQGPPESVPAGHRRTHCLTVQRRLQDITGNG